MVRWGGVEPPRLAAHGPQPCLSANSSTSAESSGIITVSTVLVKSAFRRQPSAFSRQPSAEGSFQLCGIFQEQEIMLKFF